MDKQTDKREIKSKEDIVFFVNEFYSQVKADELIGPIFNERLTAEKWGVHLEKMHRFWNSALFGASDYRGHPFAHHIHLPVEGQHFERWMQLFIDVIKDNFSGEKAEEAIWRAEKMRQMFELRLANIRSNPDYKPLF